MKLGYSIVSAGFVSLLLLLSTPAIAKPVTAADLNGKTVCWNNGDRETYLSGGKYKSTVYGEGTWELVSSGVVSVRARSYDWTSAIEKLADGTFEAKTNASNTSQIFTGHYCK